MLEPGDIVSERYEILRRIGEGGFGVVYLAADHSLCNLPVALKILPDTVSNNAQLTSRLAREILALNRIVHPNIVRFYDFIRNESEIGFTMEYVEGTLLETEIVEATQFSSYKITQILIGITKGLGAIHRTGLVHRDLKPDNIMLLSQGGVKIIDFGLALMYEDIQHQIEIPIDEQPRKRRRRLTVEGELIGTPEYFSPEYISTGTVDARSDIYSVGLIAYELFTGEIPFENPDITQLLADRTRCPAPELASICPDCPQELSRIVAKMLSIDADQRYQTAAELEADLEEVLFTIPKPIRRSEAKLPTQTPPPAPARFGKRAAGMLLALIVSLLAFVSWEAFQPPHHSIELVGPGHQNAGMSQ